MMKPASCNGCPLERCSDGFILPEGLGTNGVAIIGEAGGYNEYVENLPFRPKAQAGSKLEEVFKIASSELSRPISRQQFVMYNVVNCHPHGDRLDGESYERGAIEKCSSNVDEVFRSNPQVKVILALGNIALKALTGVSGVAEEKQSISHLRGYIFNSKYGLVVPGLHPSFIRRGNPHLTPLLVSDLKKALAVARGDYTSYHLHKSYNPPNYQVSPSLDDAWSFYYGVRDNSKLVVAYDIETPKSGNVDEDERDELEDRDIIQVQFSVKRGTGIAMPYRDEYVRVIDAILRLPNTKVNHNTWNFDNPRLKAKGHDIAGVIHDCMWMFKHWNPSLPRGLQSVVSLIGFPFPWKHLYGSKLEWYGCADVDAVQWILHSYPQLMKERGIWDGYMRHVVKIHPILERASNIGIPVSDDKRIALEKEFRTRRDIENKAIQGIVPLEIRNIKPKRKDKETGEVSYGYIRRPKLVDDENSRYQDIATQLTARGKRVCTFEEYVWRKHNLAYAEFKDADVRDSGENGSEYRWCIIEDFKASSQQLIKYLKWRQVEVDREVKRLEGIRQAVYGGKNPELTGKIKELRELSISYKVPVNFKTKKQTTAKGELEEIYQKTGDEVLERVVRIRSLDTNLNNYIPNWKPAKDGRVHTTWGFTAASGQFDARRPNVLNASKHTEYGNEFRGIIEAPIGYTFVEFDKKSYHVGTMGYVANDEEYIRFSQLDPHSILGSHIDPSVIGVKIDPKWSDKDILEASKKFKKRCKEIEESGGVNIRQAIAKPTVLGNQLGLGPKKLQYQNRKYIKSVRDAEEFQHIIAGMFSKVEAIKTEIKHQAYVNRFMIDEFERICYFYDVYVFQWSKKFNKWERRDGEGAREPIAFRVQGTAFGALQISILNLESGGYNEEFNFCNSIHDSVIYMPEIGKLDKCIEVVSKELDKPCPFLVNSATGPAGLRIGTEISVGRNWRSYDEGNKEGMREIKR